MNEKIFDPITPWEINKYEKAIFPCDAYKLSHRIMYPKNTTNLVCTLVARGSSKSYNVFKNFVWSLEFSRKIVTKVLSDFENAVKKIGIENGKGTVSKIIKEKIWKVFGFEKLADDYLSVLVDLGNYLLIHNKLPLIIKAKKSNEFMEYQSALLTIKGIENIDKKNAWLINYFETIFLENIWQHMTSLTIARNFKKLADNYARITADNNDFVKFQCHDFSMRGMSSFETAIYSASAHLQYFQGSDTILGSQNAFSVMASEHSVMSADGEELEFQTYERLIDENPNGILSLVSDTYNIWNVLDNILPKLKNKILSRNGKLVIRPDSGNPVEIVCGKKNYSFKDKSTWGVIHYLDYHFGHKHNKKKFKSLNEKIGIIYGDAVTYEVASNILKNLKNQGWCSDCIAFGIGATTYQSNTRDTLGFVIKATAIQKENNNEKKWFNIYKNPITDKNKKSITGTFEDEPDMVQIY